MAYCFDAETALRKQIMIDAAEKFNDVDIFYGGQRELPTREAINSFSAVQVAETYQRYRDVYCSCEVWYRRGDFDTEIYHYAGRRSLYKSKVVARQLDNGRYIAWVYYYSEDLRQHVMAEEMEWINSAMYVDMHEDTRVVKVFSKPTTRGTTD